MPPRWDKLRELFDEEPDGYLRFRQTLLRDSAYQGLPFKLRRRLHGAVAARLEAETEFPEEAAGTLSLHYLEAGEFQPAWRYATAAAKRAESVYAYVEAAGLYARALEAGSNLPDLPRLDIGRTQEALGNAWFKAGEYRKALDAYTAAQGQVAGNRLLEADLLIKLSWVEERLGRYPEALRWVERAREALGGVQGLEADRQNAAASVWYATVLQAQGRTEDALKWAERGAREARGRGRSRNRRRRVHGDGVGPQRARQGRRRGADAEVARRVSAFRQPCASGEHPVQSRLGMLLGRPLGRRDDLFRARSRRVGRGRQSDSTRPSPHWALPRS